MDTIDLTPTTPEYANMARFFSRAIVDDARKERRKDTAVLLTTFAEIIAYLAVNTPAKDVKLLLADIKRDVGADRG